MVAAAVVLVAGAAVVNQSGGHAVRDGPRSTPLDSLLGLLLFIAFINSVS
jgi:hypothetical protein